MKKIIITLLAITTFSVAFAQVKYNTGNVEFDTDLGIVNANAKLDLKTFKLNISTTHNLPIPKVEELLQIMEPAEIILAADIAQVAQKPIDAVVISYKKNKDKGWGVIAKEMGIKPGSPEFHALKGKTKTRKDKGKSEGKGKGNGNSKGKGNGKNK